ncbi:hypothetical protein CGC20_33280 [Leishmania donovani]|uniref:Uncharacterized protein n=3 Tax=Leishmania donovani TaxID=5661 RepID=A0A504XAW7_LEIDO|nr:hypothetical protein CGC20_33280 [Leishmania donovani]TPP47632.1 hypothetical protein CGC21_31370 [Leishmania donovani]
MLTSQGERVAGTGEKNRSLTSSPSSDMLSQLISHVSRSAVTPYGARVPKESAESVLLKQRMEVMKTVAAIRANEDTFGGARVSRHGCTLPQTKAAPRDTTRRPLYTATSSNQYKTIKDLKAGDGTEPGAVQLKRTSLVHDASGTLVTAESPHGNDTESRDPRKAVAEKHRAALVTPRPHVPTRIEQWIGSFGRSLGAVKPYAVGRSTKLATRHCFTDLPVDTNDRYVDRMQCCRPSKGLYTYY